MNITALLVILLILLVCGGGGYYYHAPEPNNLVGILIAVLVIGVLLRLLGLV